MAKHSGTGEGKAGRLVTRSFGEETCGQFSQNGPEGERTCVQSHIVHLQHRILHDWHVLDYVTRQCCHAPWERSPEGLSGRRSFSAVSGQDDSPMAVCWPPAPAPPVSVQWPMCEVALAAGTKATLGRNNENSPVGADLTPTTVGCPVFQLQSTMFSLCLELNCILPKKMLRSTRPSLGM